MAYKLIITPVALADVADAYTYYESKQPDLGARFSIELQNTYNKLIQNPQLYSFISQKRQNKLRDLKIKGFPYLVIFDIADDLVTVYGVFNTYQRPL